VNLKTDPEESEVLRRIYPSIIPAWHMNKRHWISVGVGESITERVLEELVEDAYLRVMYSLPKAKRPIEFRERPYARAWEGHTDAPRVETAVEIRDALLEAYDLPFEEGGVDELHIVYTEFKSMVVQEPKILRLLPIHVGDAKAMGEEIVPDQELTKAEYEQAASFEFEPSAEEVLNALLPRYIASRIFSCLLQAAASELASRQRAMKTAGDNAETLITKYTRLMNNARQAEITQELSEIVGGADALGS